MSFRFVVLLTLLAALGAITPQHALSDIIRFTFKAEDARSGMTISGTFELDTTIEDTKRSANRGVYPGAGKVSATVQGGDADGAVIEISNVDVTVNDTGNPQGQIQLLDQDRRNPALELRLIHDASWHVMNAPILEAIDLSSTQLTMSRLKLRVDPDKRWQRFELTEIARLDTLPGAAAAASTPAPTPPAEIAIPEIAPAPGIVRFALMAEGIYKKEPVTIRGMLSMDTTVPNSPKATSDRLGVYDAAGAFEGVVIGGTAHGTRISLTGLRIVATGGQSGGLRILMPKRTVEFDLKLPSDFDFMPKNDPLPEDINLTDLHPDLSKLTIKPEGRREILRLQVREFRRVGAVGS